MILVTRLPTSAVAAVLVGLPQYLSGSVSPVAALLNSAPLCLATMAAFSLNDLCDQKKDRVNKPHRALPSGLISPVCCVVVTLGAAAISIVSALWIHTSWHYRLFYAITCTALFAYNLIVRLCPIVKTVYTGCLSVGPLFYATQIFPRYSSGTGIVVSSLLFIIGRELMMDVYDIEGDRLAGARTVPIILGNAKTVGLSLGLQATAILSLWNLPPHNHPYRVLLATLVVVLTLLSIAGVTTARRSIQRCAILWQWIPITGGLWHFMLYDSRI